MKEVILAVQYQPQAMKGKLAEFEQEFDIKIICSVEDQPLGTAGPLKLAE